MGYYSRTLNKSGRSEPTIEKEETAVIEAIRKWSHFLQGGCFTLHSGQRSISDDRSKEKIHKLQNFVLEN